MRRLTYLVLFLFATTTLAGCSDGGSNKSDDANIGQVGASATTGGIRGLVVDQAFAPIKGAKVQIINTELKTETDEAGTFVFNNIAPGAHFLEVSKPLYATVQKEASVVAGVKEPEIVKVQLTRVIAEDPYLVTDDYKGFITCSINLVIFLSEECGEGVGVPCDVPPPVGCQRVGGQENNRAQIDFTVDGPFVKTLIVEQNWKPSVSVGAPGAQSGGFYTVVATQWSCLPVCQGHRLGEGEGASPLLIRIDNETLEGAELTADTIISSFTWAASDETGVLLNQEFQLFVSAFYHLPAPEEWSYIAGSPDPFK